jgi:hypothetical protein
MKKYWLIKIFTLILLLGLPLLSQAQFVVADIKRIVMEYINDALMEKDKQKQNDKLQKLKEILQEAKKIKQRNTEILDIDEDIEKELRSLGNFKNLSLTDINRLMEKINALKDEDFIHDLPHMGEFMTFYKQSATSETTNSFYDFLLGGTTAYAAMNDYPSNASYLENMQLQHEQASKRYSIETMIAKRKLNTALSYQQLSKDLIDQATDLSVSINKEGSWHMSNSEDDENITDEFTLFDPTGNMDKVTGFIDEKTKSITADMGGEDGMFKNLFEKISPLGKLLDFFGKDKDKGSEITSLLGLGEGDMLGFIDGLFGNNEEVLSPGTLFKTSIEKEGLRLTSGERMAAQKTALDNVIKAMDLQLEADRLTIEAIGKTTHQKRVDAAYQRKAIRESLIKTKL